MPDNANRPKDPPEVNVPYTLDELRARSRVFASDVKGNDGGISIRFIREYDIVIDAKPTRDDWYTMERFKALWRAKHRDAHLGAVGE